MGKASAKDCWDCSMRASGRAVQLAYIYLSLTCSQEHLDFVLGTETMFSGCRSTKTMTKIIYVCALRMCTVMRSLPATMESEHQLLCPSFDQMNCQASQNSYTRKLCFQRACVSFRNKHITTIIYIEIIGFWEFYMSDNIQNMFKSFRNLLPDLKTRLMVVVTFAMSQQCPKTEKLHIFLRCVTFPLNFALRIASLARR